MATDSPDTDGGAGTPYSLSEEERAYIRSGLQPTQHCSRRFRERAPQDAKPVSHAVGHATVDETIADHPFWAARPDDDETTAVAVYRGRTESGTTYGMVFPVATDADRGPLAVTAYRVRSVPTYAEVWDLDDEVGTALKSYLSVLGDQGGIVDE